ncbi:transporter associated domain-containing protein [Salmonirosea aquatica]|uniref:CBS domain-containing protein n=1 Tax=Salmonirosea aquatica TaxID=2654236 RepID=A0A7C9BGK5_9BACT|nr:CBS domain-containing protein [Cytophagaceae bacterium SJW1-29]
MKEKSDKDDPSRTCREPEPFVHYNPRFRNVLPIAQLPILVASQSFFSEFILLGVLLLISLLLSALRAAYGVISITESPWERRSAAEPLMLSAPQKLTLSLFQRGSTLLAFLLAAHLAWKITQDPELNAYTWVPVLALVIWLWVDALVRYYAGHNALAFTRKATPLIKPAAAFLTRTGNVFSSIGTKWRVLLPDEAKGRSEQNESDSENEEERDLLRGLATFGQTTARQTMQPRLNITAVDIELDFHELMDKINKSGYSRIPVYDDTLDSVEGILYVKDLLPHLHRDEHFAWQKLLRKAYFIPESKRLDDLMQEFQNRRVHMAIVVDEYGGTNGLITLEDIIEEIFGDINDEYDEAEEVNYTQVDDKTYIFEGKVLLNDFCKILSLESDYFEDVRRASESLGGLLLELFSQLPRTGEQVAYRDLTFKVQSADKKRIKKVRVIVG